MKEVLIEGKGKFKVKVSPPDVQWAHEASISVTHNGYQWSGFWFYEEELPLIIQALKQSKFKKNKQ